jgi:hypothetical protein
MNRSCILFGALRAASVVLLIGSASPASAQPLACPIVNDAVISNALGVPVEQAVNPDQPRGMDVCYFTTPDETDFAVERLLGAFGPDDPGGLAALARKFVTPSLSDAARAQVDALTQVGASVTVTDHQLSVVDGIGDYAVAARNQVEPGWIRDSLLVQRGNDAFVFEVDEDTPDAANQLRTVALAVMGSLIAQ